MQNVAFAVSSMLSLAPVLAVPPAGYLARRGRWVRALAAAIVLPAVAFFALYRVEWGLSGGKPVGGPTAALGVGTTIALVSACLGCGAVALGTRFRR